MPRPRKEPVKYVNTRIPAETKVTAENLAGKSYQSLTAWTKAAILAALEEPGDLFAAFYPPVPFDGPTVGLFLEVPVSLANEITDRIGKGSRLVDIGCTVGRIIHARASTMVAA